MKLNKHACLVILGAVLLTSCATSGPDKFLVQNISAQDKAEFLFRQGVAQYNERLLEQNDLKAIPNVRQFFENALLADPLHPLAQAYINKVDSFKATQFRKYMARAQKLQAKGKRTESEDYEMAYAVQRASDINSYDTNLIKLKFATSEPRKNIVAKRLANLSTLETKILSEKKALMLGKLVPQATRVLSEIQNVDPNNSQAAKSRKNIDSYISDLVKPDIATARAKLEQKKYGEAEAAILRADKTISGLDSETSNEIQSLKYQVYLRWGNELLLSQKFERADEKVAQAMSINRTAEAIDLKTKINKAASVRDYDADTDDIIGNIDAQLSRGDISGAWTSITVNMTRLKKQANKDLLAEKKTEVLAQMKTVYADAVTAYNQEDYETARTKFRAVVRIDTGYEQAQAYLERTNNKLRALTGDD